MKISEIISQTVIYARTAKGGAGGKASIKQKWRCDAGPRAGRIVAKPADCGGAIDVKKRAQMKKTRAAKGGKMTRKAKKTKRINPASKKIKRLNK